MKFVTALVEGIRGLNFGLLRVSGYNFFQNRALGVVPGHAINFLKIDLTRSRFCGIIVFI